MHRSSVLQDALHMPVVETVCVKPMRGLAILHSRLFHIVECSTVDGVKLVALFLPTKRAGQNGTSMRRRQRRAPLAYLRKREACLGKVQPKSRSNQVRKCRLAGVRVRAWERFLGWDHGGTTKTGQPLNPRISAGFRSECESCRRTTFHPDRPL